MTERQPPTPEQITGILHLAISAAGPMDDMASWRGKIQTLVPEIVATVAEGSKEHRLAHDMMTAVVLAGEYLGFDYHDRSTRCKVHLQADHSRKGEPEHVWSERTDTTRGAAQLSILRSLPKGCKVLVWKGTEQISDDQKVRMMFHIMRIDADVIKESDPDADAQPASGSAPPPPTPPRREPPAGETASPPEGDASSVRGPSLAAALERLSNAQRVAVAKWAKDQEIYNIYDEHMPADSANSVMAHIELLLQGMTE